MSNDIEIELMKTMAPDQKVAFMNAMAQERKNTSTMVLLTLLLGGVGVHHYYIRNTVIGVLYTLFSWTFLPAIWALIFDSWMSPSYVRTYNRQKAKKIAQQIHAGWAESPSQIPS